MLFGVDLGTVSFAEPLYLWLLIAPAVLVAALVWQVLRRRADARRLVRERLVPVEERHPLLGDLAFWFALTFAIACCILALARPVARVSTLRTASADIVILQDGSASMHVTDVAPNRWRRSVQFLRAFGQALSWRGDRVALAIFAYHAAPQVRLTKDPNALFFFIDHLGDQPPFAIEDNPTWNTNIETGVSWGLQLVATDEKLFGKTNNPKAFVVISDGQAWSGTRGTGAGRCAGARRQRVCGGRRDHGRRRHPGPAGAAANPRATRSRRTCRDRPRGRRAVLRDRPRA